LWDACVEILRQTVSRALEKKSFCMVPYDELKRVWPNAKDRVENVSVFAGEHDWRLFSCVDGLGAMIVRKDYSFDPGQAGLS
jgi:hypothetical protein